MLQIIFQQFGQLCVDIPTMWTRFGGQYLHGMWNTIVLAVLATLIRLIRLFTDSDKEEKA